VVHLSGSLNAKKSRIRSAQFASGWPNAATTAFTDGLGKECIENADLDVTVRATARMRENNANTSKASNLNMRKDHFGFGASRLVRVADRDTIHDRLVPPIQSEKAV